MIVSAFLELKSDDRTLYDLQESWRPGGRAGISSEPQFETDPPESRGMTNRKLCVEIFSRFNTSRRRLAAICRS